MHSSDSHLSRSSWQCWQHWWWCREPAGLPSPGELQAWASALQTSAGASQRWGCQRHAGSHGGPATGERRVWQVTTQIKCCKTQTSSLSLKVVNDSFLNQEQQPASTWSFLQLQESSWPLCCRLTFCVKQTMLQRKKQGVLSYDVRTYLYLAIFPETSNRGPPNFDLKVWWICSTEWRSRPLQ